MKNNDTTITDFVAPINTVYSELYEPAPGVNFEDFVEGFVERLHETFQYNARFDTYDRWDGNERFLLNGDWGSLCIKDDGRALALFYVAHSRESIDQATQEAEFCQEIEEYLFTK